MAAKLGSFRYSFAEKRERDKLLHSKGYSSLGIPFLEHPSHEQQPNCFASFTTNGWNAFRQFISKSIEMGKSDPSKVIYSAKMGLALTLLSFLIFLKKPFEELGKYSVWAILTVVVVFEFSVGILLFSSLSFSIFFFIILLSDYYSNFPFLITSFCFYGMIPVFMVD